jgi:hypothetical protein
MRKPSLLKPGEIQIYCDRCNIQLTEDSERNICTICESDVCASHLRHYGILPGGGYIGECCTRCLGKGGEYIKLMVAEKKRADERISGIKKKWRKQVKSNGKNS